MHQRSLAYCPPGLPLSTVLKHCAAISLMPIGTELPVSRSGTSFAAPPSLMSMGPSRPGTWLGLGLGLGLGFGFGLASRFGFGLGLGLFRARVELRVSVAAVHHCLRLLTLTLTLTLP